ncbi:hypothetical protein OG568_16465 [Streptomyces sp. NBC_01450]|uniref:hypothetical protein n=1 Tax=Streptomyces sp. NBC_01450 TaxID=2903871 RepID=UPI002E3356BF|nr:hypothetical protein [Streptomyces sp. NBC_01450]
MNSELPDLNPQSAADEMTSHTVNHFTTFLLGIALVAPWLLLFMPIMSGKLLWLTVLDLIGTHVGLVVMLRGYRDDNRALKRWGQELTLQPCCFVSWCSRFCSDPATDHPPLQGLPMDIP